MKIRQGFVSNSSASSFVCGFCGEYAEGWDGEYGFEVLTCKNYHTLCGEHVTNRPEDDFDELPAKYCPLCNFEEVDIVDVNLYIYRITKYSREKAKKEIQERFKNYKEFEEWLKI